MISKEDSEVVLFSVARVYIILVFETEKKTIEQTKKAEKDTKKIYTIKNKKRKEVEIEEKAL